MPGLRESQISHNLRDKESYFWSYQSRYQSRSSLNHPLSAFAAESSCYLHPTTWESCGTEIKTYYEGAAQHFDRVHRVKRARKFVSGWISCNSPAFSAKERLSAHLVKKHDVPRSNTESGSRANLPFFNAFPTKERLEAHLLKMHDVPRSNIHLDVPFLCLWHGAPSCATFWRMPSRTGVPLRDVGPKHNGYMKDSHPDVYGRVAEKGTVLLLLAADSRSSTV
ncbi:hypothetical protein CPC08DRAFT_722254 [Agrocybe pediades]|nr:hypothetical protein CPC08DRAFT_722254 [Agrocybe pediades]